VSVTFVPGAGSGNVTGGTQTTGVDGVARPGSWTLGPDNGPQTLNASAGALVTIITVNGATDLLRVSAATQWDAAGQPVSARPSVRAEDASGNPVAGATVTFSVTTGNGVVTGGTQTTDASGIATVGSWTLGATPGANSLTASVAGGISVVFTATGLDASGFAIEKLAGDNTACPISRVGCVFSVRVMRAGSQPAAGETVVWSNGSGTTVNTVTNLRGIATTGNIPPNNTVGARTQTATLQASGAAVTFTYQLVTDAGYNIDIRYVGDPPTPAVQAAFNTARNRWQSVVTGELSNVLMQVPAAQTPCGFDDLSLDETVDDLLILVVVDSIDGPGQVLGSAGPCYIRNSNSLPIVGVMRLDSADLAVLNTNGVLTSVILHEVGHTLGFPALWGDNFSALLEGEGTPNPFYTGSRGRQDFVVAGGTLIDGIGVPVENTGGAGTRDSHWRESVMSTELMTGFIGGVSNPLSRITIGALMDIGYQVNFGAADAYLLPGASLRAAGGQAALELRELPMPPPRVVR
jgi:hypothetical protein